eukprot:XP_014621789.1 G2/mitotic-specific cyclin-2 [Glycine max]
MRARSRTKRVLRRGFGLGQAHLEVEAKGRVGVGVFFAGKAVDTEVGQGCRQVFGDIGNLEVPRITEGKLISRPIKRNFNAKLLANEENLANVLEVEANKQGATQGKKNLIVPALDNAAIVHQEHGAEDSTHKPNPEPVDMVNFEAEDSANFVCERGSRERSRRNVKTLTSEIIAQSKKACVVLNDTKEEPVDMDADDPNEVVVAEYLEDIYRFFNLTEVPAILKSYSFHIYVFILLLLQLMMQQETDYQASDYMKKQHGINDKMRSIIVDWLVENPHEISINA